MKDTTRTEPDLTPVVPEGADPLDDLHVVELAAASRKLGADVVSCVAEDTRGLRWDAFQLVALAWAKRDDPKATVERFQALTATQLTQVLRLDEEPDNTDADQDAANPTD